MYYSLNSERINAHARSVYACNPSRRKAAARPANKADPDKKMAAAKSPIVLRLKRRRLQLGPITMPTLKGRLWLGPITMLSLKGGMPQIGLLLCKAKLTVQYHANSEKRRQLGLHKKPKRRLQSELHIDMSLIKRGLPLEQLTVLSVLNGRPCSRHTTRRTTVPG